MRRAPWFLAWYLLIFFAMLFLFSGCVFNDPRTGEDCPCHNLTVCKPCRV